MRSSFLPFSPPSIGDEEVDAVAAALRSGWLSRGPRTAEFEGEFCALIGAESALALNSCTSGLHLALCVLGVGPGDEVVVPTMTFCATANVVEHTGATVVLADVEPDTLNIDPGRLEAAITPRTKAVMVVHYGGHPAAMDEIEAIAGRHGIAIIEDAAHALPASFSGRTIGGGPHLAAFSFYATKNLTTGEGGMLVGEEELIARARVLSLHGMNGDAWGRYGEHGKWFYEVSAPGFKYNMSDLMAALGLVQLRRLSGFQSRRRAVVEAYHRGLSPRDDLRLPGERAEVQSAWHLYPIRLTESASRGRDEVISALHERNIGTSVHFIPIHLHPYYRDRYGYDPSDFPVAQSAFETLISLPLHPGLSDDDVADVVESVNTVMNDGGDVPAILL